MIVDLADLEWWQALVGIIVALGLSPAPWILGLAFGRIQFSAPAERITKERIAELNLAHVAAVEEIRGHHAAQIASKDERYGELKSSRDSYREAVDTEGKRNEALTEKLSEAVDVTKLAVHAIESLEQIAKQGPVQK